MNSLPYSDIDPLVLECKALITEIGEPKKLPFNETLNEIDFNRFQDKILDNIEKVNIDFEVGFAYKKMIECYYLDSYTYWQRCYYFLKGLAHYYNVKTWTYFISELKKEDVSQSPNFKLKINVDIIYLQLF
jgi:hypothetical protein